MVRTLLPSYAEGLIDIREGAMKGLRSWTTVALTLLFAVAGCETGSFVGVDSIAAPRGVGAVYHAGAVTVSWELAPDWDGESFRVYGKRSSDAQYYLVAEVTSCAMGLCSYIDTNVQAGLAYRYYVAAVSPGTGAESASESAIEVIVPDPTPPSSPSGLTVVALDHANYVTWDDNARGAADFSHYRVWLSSSDGGSFLLGESDSEGFLDLLAENGLTYTYYVTSLDEGGHESAASAVARGTPRPDYEGEWLYDHFDVPGSSGFRFRTSDRDDPVVDGNDPERHFRLESDASGWWLAPAPGADFHPEAWATTALKCGPAADPDCADVTSAPSDGYAHHDIEAIPQSTYVLRVRGDDGQIRYGAIRIVLLGEDKNGSGLMIFDWSYQLQPGSVELAPRPAAVR